MTHKTSIKTIAFDINGTLIDADPSLQSSVLHLLKFSSLLGMDVWITSSLSLQEISYFVERNSLEDYVSNLVSKINLIDDNRPDFIVDDDLTFIHSLGIPGIHIDNVHKKLSFIHNS